MLNGILRKFVYPCPSSAYTENDMPGTLCWIPWNDAIAAPHSSQALPTECGKGPVECNPLKQLAAQDGPPWLPCVWLPAKRSATVLFYFHANAEDLSVVHSALVHLQKQLQVSVLALEYPGYGLLKDFTPSEESIRNAAMVALRFMVSEIGVTYAQVMLLGRSLGGSPAIFLASRFPVGGLILVNSFTSLAAAAEGHVGKTFSRIAFGDLWNNEEIIGNVSCAVLFIHAARDRTVPMEHSAKLFQKCRSRKLLITPEGMEHNSHLFADPQFLAVPAIHFFHFPCYQTDNPPKIPAQFFKPPHAPQQQKLESEPVWNCAARGCKLSGHREDEVAVPVDAVVLGEVDVPDKIAPKPPTSKQASARRNRYPERDSIASVARVGSEKKPEFEQKIAAPRCFESSRPPKVAPGDESAGWPTTSGWPAPASSQPPEKPQGAEEQGQYHVDV